MSKALVQYFKQIHKQLGRFPTWLPGDRIDIGDVGVLAKGRFRRIGSLAELGIQFEVESSPVSQPLRYQSSKGLAVAANARGKASGAGSLDLQFGFSQAGSCVFEATGVIHHRITNRLAVGNAAVAAHKAGRWDKDWHLIDELWTADCATVIVAETKDSSLGISGKIDSPAAGLANPSAGLQVTSRSGKTVEIIAARDVRPLYMCSKIRGLGGNVRLQPVFSTGAETDTKDVDDPIEHADIDELIESIFEDDEDDDDDQD